MHKSNKWKFKNFKNKKSTLNHDLRTYFVITCTFYVRISHN